MPAATKAAERNVLPEADAAIRGGEAGASAAASRTRAKRVVANPDELLLVGETLDENGGRAPAFQTKAELAAEMDAEDAMLDRLRGCVKP